MMLFPCCSNDLGCEKRRSAFDLMDPRDIAAVFDLNCSVIEDGMAQGVIILEEDDAIDRVMGDDADTFNVAQGPGSNTVSAGTTAGTVKRCRLRNLQVMMRSSPRRPARMPRQNHTLTCCLIRGKK